MADRTIRGALLLPALAAAGCGTAANLCDPSPGGKAPFGGVDRDRAGLGRAAAEPWGPPAPAQPPGWWAVLCALDLPLSGVGDLLTLPYVRAYRWINEPVGYAPLGAAGQPLAVPPLGPPPTSQPAPAPAAGPQVPAPPPAAMIPPPPTTPVPPPVPGS